MEENPNTTAKPYRVFSRKAVARCSLLVLIASAGAWPAFSPNSTNRSTQTDAPVRAPERGPGITYFPDSIEDVPWSIHIVKIDRSRTNFSLETTFGRSNQLGMTLVSEQVKALPSQIGRPVAAVNGDFYKNTSKYPGDPEGIQIVQGELISAPRPTHSCFWMDASGNPRITNVQSNFKVTLPNGQSATFGLNEERANDAVVLYSSANGSSTRTSGGVELLVAPSDKHSLPLHVGETFSARVRRVQTDGNSPLTRDTLVLSVGPKISAQVAGLKSGDLVQISTATAPQMTGCKTAIGGGPALVRGRTALPLGLQPRAPRTAIGWNKDYFFLVEVDGRQRISAGMTFSELAAYMVKLGCDEANNLDGGGSATMWVYGNVMNSPSEGRERPAANALVVVRTDRHD